MKQNLPNSATPRYKAIKKYILDKIDSEELQAGGRVHSESELCKIFGVSRMTVNRALREMTEEHLLVRVQGTGTFVAEKRPTAELLELKNIADEIRETGKQHSSIVYKLERVQADGEISALMNISDGVTVYHSIIVHLADEEAVQVEDRYVNPELAPDYFDEDFTTITPNEYLLKQTPLTEVEHIVEAVLPDKLESELLGINSRQPCLRLRRRTMSGQDVATVAWLTHPGNKHKFGTRFKYSSDGKAQRSTPNS